MKKTSSRLFARLQELRGPLSQVEFSRKIGTKQTTYSSWERGIKEPPLSTIEALSRQFGVSTDWLLGISDDKRGGAMSDAAASKVAALEKRIEELEVRNRALIDALEAVGKGANSSTGRYSC